ncbi:MAG: DUF485 domain-containing protein [Deltaproteobacteria bacterium]|nr:DUF485 domain-containing protein [Deltaproteobacteria bacterium]
MAKTAHEIVTSERFKALVRKRWNISIILTILLFIIYYGYILIIGYGKEFLGEKVGVYTNYGIIFGVLVIVLSWILTVIYVVWANTVYDKEVDAIKKELL